jgi:N-methylhydantoinase B
MDDSGFEGTAPVRIHAALTVRDGVLEVDLTGSGDQVPSGVNVPLASTHAAVYFAVRCFVGEGIHQNAGLTRQIRVLTRPGSILHPEFPAAVSARHLTVQRVADVMVDALGALLPDRVVAASHVAFPTFVFQAVDPRFGGVRIFTDILGGGGGARPNAAGDDAIDTYAANCALLPAEVAELEYPWRVLRSELVEGSGGAGAHPGGRALRRDYLLLAERADGMYYVEQLHPRSAALGRQGGGPGAPARVAIRRAGAQDEERLAGKGHIALARGDVITFVSSGGGGFGAQAP